MRQATVEWAMPVRWPSGLRSSAAATWASSARVSSTGPEPGASSSSATMAARLVGGLAGSVDRLGHALAQRPVVVDPGEPEVGEGQAAQAVDGVVGGDRAHLDGVEQSAEGGLVHVDSMLSRHVRHRMHRRRPEPRRRMACVSAA